MTKRSLNVGESNKNYLSSKNNLLMGKDGKVNDVKGRIDYCYVITFKKHFLI